ncbi:MAG: NAD-dependent epimerase/dehydratase family protein [Planctomycetia bacterium]|nr:NAD-dependent epimerase/dehydratase family protein [Planctomycetia bacterium]
MAGIAGGRPRHAAASRSARFVNPPPPSTSRPAAHRLVVGCGFLGTRVAARWVAAGARVFGVTRRESRAAELAATGIEPLVADVAASTPGGPTLADAIRNLRRIDTVFWSVGFDRSAAATYRDVHVTGLSRLLDTLHAIGLQVRPAVIVSSSTGVWGDADGAGRSVDESTPAHPSREAGRVLLEAESLVRRHPLGPGVALRFAGLYGPGRLPRIDDLRAARPMAADPDSWLNLIHVDDAARIVCRVAEAAAGNDAVPRPLYVVSDGRPVRRREWYGRLAELAGTPPPIWDTAAPRPRGGDKRVDPRRLFADLPMALDHPDSLQAIGEILADAR